MIKIIILNIAISLFFLLFMVLAIKETKETKTQKQITHKNRIKHYD